LNGCEYPPQAPARRPGFFDLLDLFRSRTIRWSGAGEPLAASQFIAYARLTELGRRSTAPETLLTAVSRVGEQKLLLLREPGTGGKSGLTAVLEALGPEGCFVLLGTGDRDYEQFLASSSARHANFVFLNGYSDACARALYAVGDLFLMPSSFEPCGLGQMLAMRDGQPCLVHAVGGLKDTVRHHNNGFVFQGQTLEAQVDQLVATLQNALKIKHEKRDRWRKICANAAATRYRWSDLVEVYLEKLYRGSDAAPEHCPGTGT
jgi:starch synthase